MATEQVIRVSNVKIERKFVPTPLLQAQLDGKYGEFERLRRDQGGQAAAQQSSALSFFRVPDKQMEDTYIDYHGRMEQNGICMRKRISQVVQTDDFPIVNDAEPKSQWQAKVLLDSDKTYAQMLEAESLTDLAKIVHEYAPGLKLKDFAATAKIATLRKIYVVHKPFGWQREVNQAGEIRVLVDQVVAGHEESQAQADGILNYLVGKVEVTAEVSGGDSDAEHDLIRREKMAEMHARLAEFVRRNMISFPGERIKGKLEAYKEWWEKRDGVGAII